MDNETNRGTRDIGKRIKQGIGITFNELLNYAQASKRERLWNDNLHLNLTVASRAYVEHLESLQLVQEIKISYLRKPFDIQDTLKNADIESLESGESSLFDRYGEHIKREYLKNFTKAIEEVYEVYYKTLHNFRKYTRILRFRLQNPNLGFLDLDKLPLQFLEQQVGTIDILPMDLDAVYQSRAVFQKYKIETEDSLFNGLWKEDVPLNIEEKLKKFFNEVVATLEEQYLDGALTLLTSLGFSFIEKKYYACGCSGIYRVPTNVTVKHIDLLYNTKKIIRGMFRDNGFYEHEKVYLAKDLLIYRIYLDNLLLRFRKEEKYLEKTEEIFNDLKRIFERFTIYFFEKGTIREKDEFNQVYLKYLKDNLKELTETNTDWLTILQKLPEEILCCYRILGTPLKKDAEKKDVYRVLLDIREKYQKILEYFGCDGETWVIKERILK